MKSELIAGIVIFCSVWLTIFALAGMVVKIA